MKCTSFAYRSMHTHFTATWCVWVGSTFSEGLHWNMVVNQGHGNRSGCSGHGLSTFVLLIHMCRDIIACIGTSVTKLIHIHAPHALRACINYSYMQLTWFRSMWTISTPPSLLTTTRDPHPGRATVCYITQGTPTKLENVVDLPTEPYHLQHIQQLAVQCKAQKWYESQSRQLKKWRWENFLRALYGQIDATHLYALPLAVAVLV